MRISSWLLAVVILFLSGCGPDVPEHVEWDLSESHVPSDVDWEPRSDKDGTVMEGIESVRIELPGGHVFEASSDVHDVTLGNDGDLLTLVAVEFQPESVDEAYKRATEFAAEWDLTTKYLDGWYRRASRPNAPLPDITGAQRDESLAGPKGPFVMVQIRPYTSEAPALVSFQIEWLPP